MAEVKYPTLCDLCGQAVEIDGFFTDTGRGRKKFCCAGCQSIYHLLYENNKNKNNNLTSNSTDTENIIKNEDN